MAQIPKLEFDAGDATFSALDNNAKAYLNSFLSQQVQLATRAMRVANLNTCIEIPVYDAKRMTSATFFQKCTNYFHAQGYLTSDHHLYLPVIMKGEFKLWYDSVSSSIAD